MTTTDVSFQFGDGPLFAATHVSVGRVGSELVSTFVFDDGLVRDPSGVAIIATRGTVATLPALVAALKAQSPAMRAAFERPLASLQAPPRPYVAVWEPLRATFFSVQALEFHDAAYLAFAVIDPYDMPPKAKADSTLPLPRVPAPRVTVSTDAFVSWVSVIMTLTEEGERQ